MQTIVWDVDDVLNDLTRAWFEGAWHPAHPERELRYEDLTENPPHRVLGVELDPYLVSLDAFRLSEEGRNLEPAGDLLTWFRQHGAAFRHVALTATPRICAPHVAAWVMRHFGDWIRSFHFVPSPRAQQPVPLYDQGKGEFLRWFGRADVFVDDNPAQIEEAENMGIHAVLMPRPWNKGRQNVCEALNGLT